MGVSRALGRNPWAWDDVSADMTRHTALVAAILPAAAVLLLVACGGDDPTAGTGPGSAGGSPSPGSASSLTVTVDPGDGTAPQRWTLTCDPPGGTHPDPAAACALLADSADEVLAPVPEDAVCTEQWGGPQTAAVEGSWQGAPVTAEFSRINGCEISRWDRALPLLVEAGGA